MAAHKPALLLLQRVARRCLAYATTLLVPCDTRSRETLRGSGIYAACAPVVHGRKRQALHRNLSDRANSGAYGTARERQAAN